MPRFLALCLVLILLASPLFAQDRDNDGVRDEIEMALGMDPAQPDELVMVHDDKSAAEGDKLPAGHKTAPDITKLWFGNAGGDRYVWRLDFAGDFDPQGTVLILYMDVDNDLSTGRQDSAKGVDMMLTCVSGTFSPSIRNDAVATVDRKLRGVIDGKSVWMSMDMRIKQTNGQSDYRAWVLCHKSEPNNADQDNTTVVNVLGPGQSQKPKPPVASPSEFRSENLRVLSPWLGWRDDLKALGALTLPADQAKLQGMRRLDRALIPEANGATASFKLPKSGTFHPAVVLQDSAAGAEELELQLNGRKLAHAVCLANDGLFHLFTVKTPVQVKAGDTLALVAAAPAQDFQISETLLCPNIPEPRGMQISYLTAYCPPQPGETVSVDICWLTNFPCAGFVRWGEGGQRNQTSATEPAIGYNHRVRLTGLQRGQRYTAQVDLGPANDSLTSAPVTFIAQPEGSGKKSVARQRVELKVADLLPDRRLPWPVNGGIPLAKGQLYDGGKCRLLDAQGRPVPAQFKPLAWWPDGSIKWLLTSLVHNGPDPRYTLEYGEQVLPPREAEGLYVDEKENSLRVVNGAYEFTFLRDAFAPPGLVKHDRNGDRRFADDGIICEPQGLTLTDGSGQQFRSSGARADRFEFEEAGPVRVVLLAEGKLAGEAGKLMTWRCRMTFYRGFDSVPTVLTLLNDEGASVMPPTMTMISSLTLPVTVRTEQPSTNLRWLQLDDQRLLTQGKAAPQGTPAVNVAPADMGNDRSFATLGPVSVTIKDFWQTYPKAFTLDGNALTAELLPQLPADAYADYTDPKFLTQHFYWARDGQYQVPMGVALSHELLFSFGETDPARAAAAFQAPALLTASPEYICGTGAFMDLEPERPGVFDSFGQYVLKGLEGLENTRKRVREYSYMDYGDWYGERAVNWGNQEYDLQWALLVNYARSGDLRLYDRAMQAAFHTATIDSINAAPNPERLGLQYYHCLGHTGGFGMARVPDAKYWFESTGFNTGHMWTQGTYTAYCLTGDERLREPVANLAQWLAGPYARGFEQYVHRNYGWSVVALLGAYHVDPNPYYLNAARLFTDHVIAEQDPGTGVWAHTVGECTHKPLHMGGKVFMSGAVMSGLKMLDQIEPREDRKQAIIRNCDWMYNRMWHQKDNSFQYAQCTDFDSSSTHAGTHEACEGLAYDYDLTKNPIYHEMLVRSLADVMRRGPSSHGKEYAMQTRMTPYAFSAMARWGMKTLPTPPPQITVAPLTYVIPEAPFGVHVTATNSADEPREVRLEIAKLPAGVQAAATQLKWDLPPRTTSMRALFEFSGSPTKAEPVVVKYRCGEISGETAVRLVSPQPMTIGTGLGYIGADDDPLAKALGVLGQPVSRLSEVTPAALSACRGLLIGSEAHGKNVAGLASAAERLLDFIYAGGRVAVLQLQDAGYQAHYLPWPLAMSDADGTCGKITAADHALFNRPHRIENLSGVISYDTIVRADERWKVLATDNRGQPAIIEAQCGQGAVLVVQPSPDRYVVGQLTPTGGLATGTCAKFIENVLQWLKD